MKKKMCTKLLIALLIVIMVFEFGFSNIAIASQGESIEQSLNEITNLVGGIVSIIIWIPRIIITGIAYVVDKTTYVVASTGGVGDNANDRFMTPFEIFFNKYELLRVNFFSTANTASGSFINDFRKSVATWFYAMRLISSAVLLVILIYVGIRMALSTVAEDKARYKQMLADWVASLVLIFVLQYLAYGIIVLNDAIVEVLEKALTSGSSTFVGADSISDMLGEIALNATLGIGLTSIVSVFVFCAIVGQTVFFMVAYFNRMLKVGFLIIISPLISITYSIDKIGDGKAQALNRWLKEFTYTILIQPFHCVMYLALINTAFSLMNATVTPITELSLDSIVNDGEFNKLATGVLVILCLKFVNDAEKVVRTIFGFSDDNSKTSMAAGAAGAIAAAGMIKNAKNMGSAARKGLNGAVNTAKSLGGALGHDANMIKGLNLGSKIGNTKLGGALSGAAGKLGGAVSNSPIGKGLDKMGTAAGMAGKKIGAAKRGITGRAAKFAKTAKGSGIGQGAAKAFTGAKSMYGKFRGSKAVNRGARYLKRSTAQAVGAMVGMMMYSTGNTSALSAFASGKAISDGAGEFNNSSTSTQASYAKDSNDKLDEAEYEEIEESLENAKNNIDSLGGKNMTKEQVANKFNDANEKAAQAEAEAQSQKEELDKARADRMATEEKIKKAQEAKAKAKNKKGRTEAQKKIDEANNELKNQIKREDDLQKAFDRKESHANSLREEADKYKTLTSEMENAEKLEQQLANFYTEEATKDRISSRQYGASSSELESKKNEILSLILQYEMEQQNNGGQPLPESKVKSANTMVKNITNSINLSVKKDQDISISASSMVRGKKTNVGTRSQKTLNKLDKAVQDYTNMCRRNNVADAFKNVESYNGDPESLVNAIYRGRKRK